MPEFSLNIGGRKHVFLFGIHYVEGNDRFCWTEAGIKKLINAGLWRREFDGRGNLKSKPPTVPDLIRVSKRQAAVAAA
jgi:hypothetical protein